MAAPFAWFVGEMAGNVALITLHLFCQSVLTMSLRMCVGIGRFSSVFSLVLGVKKSSERVYQKTVRERLNSALPSLDCAPVATGTQATDYRCIYYYFEEIS
jgi:hypothetical protein